LKKSLNGLINKVSFDVCFLSFRFLFIIC
jgi:hypothetical protein